MHRVDVAAWIAPDERNDPQTRRKGLIDSVALIRGENEVAGFEMRADGIVNWGTDLDNPSFAEVARAVGQDEPS
ncbi:MAG: hypothetical protein ACLPZR_23920 [Solirubrobacteraceae bacterium]